jgi:pimeloyl-ACP methyl ester carboxylesterase
MLSTQTGFAEVNGTRLYYERAGSGHPIVLVHGFSLDTRMWNDQFEAFARRYHVIRYDLRGFGQSAPPQGRPYRHSDDLRALLAYLQIAHADVVGLSMGGGVALDFALDHPERVRALVLVDSTLGGYTFSDEWERDIRPVWATGRAQGIEAAKAAWQAHPLFEPIRQNPAAARAFARIVGDYSGWHFGGRDSEQARSVSAMQRLAEVRAPTLVVVGERELRDFLDIADALAQGIPGARKVVLPNVGHMSNMEAPEAFNEAVLNFLAAL